jgi:uncharacterized protein YcaQ
VADRLTYEPAVGLTAAQARRVALAAQGVAGPRPSGRVDRRHLRRVIDRVGLIQIDSVNVLVRSQELPLFARLGPHPRSMIPDALADAELFEYWVHEASLVPTRHHPLLRWAMQGEHRWGSFRRLEERRPGLVEQVLERVREAGPIAAGDLALRDGPKGTWWDWDDGKVALELLFQRGLVAAVRRPNDFARLYDLAERVLPPEVLAAPAPDEHEGRKELLVLAARSMGVATSADLADYHRQRHPVVKPLLRELVEDGRLLPATVAGWSHQAFVHPDAAVPRRVRARALLSPFDSLVWNRDRTERLFGFRYRIEIYVPAPKRVHGYYVLPFLLGDELVARVDLKADRARGALLVQRAWGEPGIAEDDVAAELWDELQLMAQWLGLSAGVEVAEAGDLSPALRRQAGRRSAVAAGPSAASG